MYILVRTYVQRWKSHCCSIFMRVFLDSYYCGLMTPGSILWLTTYRCCLWQSNVRLWPYSGCISKWWRYEACKQLHSFWHRPKAFWEADWVLLCFRCQVCLYTCNTTTVAFNRHSYSIKVTVSATLVTLHKKQRQSPSAQTLTHLLAIDSNDHVSFYHLRFLSNTTV